VINEQRAGLHVGFNRGVSVSELVNIAVFTGVTLRSTIFSIAVQTDGATSGVPSSQLQCQSTQAGAIQVASNCLSVFVDGSETTGTRHAGIEFSVGTFTAHLNVTVWMPTLPVRMATRLATLQPVLGWTWRNPVTSQCDQMFQRTTVDAWANFSEGSSSRVEARVTSLIEPLLTSSNTGVATVSETRIVGNGSGIATISAQRAGRTLGSVTITVADLATSNVSATTLQVFVATALSMQPMTSPFVGGVNSDEVSISNQLELEDAPAGIAA
jgi:hypothetical protein